MSSRWQPLNLAAPEYDEPPEPPALVGLVYRGKRHLVSGPPEACKTVFAYIVLLEHMRAGGVAALIDAEMGPRAARALLTELGATCAELSRLYYVEPDVPPASADLEAMVDAGVTLAVVDAAAGAYAISGLDDGKRQDAERFARMWLDPLWRQGVTTLTVDHVVKDSEARGRYAIGSERKVGGADVHLGLEVVTRLRRGGSGLIRFRAHKDRPGWLPEVPAELELSSDPESHAISWVFRPARDDGDGWRPTVLMDRVLEHLATHPEPVSRSSLADAVRGRRQYVLQAVDELITEGRLRLDGGKVVPVPGTFPERNVPPVPPLTGGNGNGNGTGNGGTPVKGDDDIPF